MVCTSSTAALDGPVGATGWRTFLHDLKNTVTLLGLLWDPPPCAPVGLQVWQGCRSHLAAIHSLLSVGTPDMLAALSRRLETLSEAVTVLLSQTPTASALWRQDMADVARSARDAVHQIANQHTPRLRPASLEQLILRACRHARRLCRINGRAIHIIAGCGAGVLLHTSTAQLMRVLDNVLKNAIEATPDGGQVQVTGQLLPGNTALIQVTDTGSGMSLVGLQQALQPGFSTKESGWGLGLTSSSAILTRLGGSLTIASAPGRGTTVNIRLPGVG